MLVVDYGFLEIESINHNQQSRSIFFLHHVGVKFQLPGDNTIDQQVVFFPVGWFGKSWFFFSKFDLNLNMLVILEGFPDSNKNITSAFLGFCFLVNFRDHSDLPK